MAHSLGVLTHFRAIEVRTIDGYQGKEKEVVLLSLTRCNREFEAEFEIFCMANQNRDTVFCLVRKIFLTLWI